MPSQLRPRFALQLILFFFVTPAWAIGPVQRLPRELNKPEGGCSTNGVQNAVVNGACEPEREPPPRNQDGEVDHTPRAATQENRGMSPELKEKMLQCGKRFLKAEYTCSQRSPNIQAGLEENEEGKFIHRVAFVPGNGGFKSDAPVGQSESGELQAEALDKSADWNDSQAGKCKGAIDDCSNLCTEASRSISLEFPSRPDLTDYMARKLKECQGFDKNYRAYLHLASSNRTAARSARTSAGASQAQSPAGEARGGASGIPDTTGDPPVRMERTVTVNPDEALKNSDPVVRSPVPLSENTPLTTRTASLTGSDTPPRVERDLSEPHITAPARDTAAVRDTVPARDTSADTRTKERIEPQQTRTTSTGTTPASETGGDNSRNRGGGGRGQGLFSQLASMFKPAGGTSTAGTAGMHEIQPTSAGANPAQMQPSSVPANAANTASSVKPEALPSFEKAAAGPAAGSAGFNEVQKTNGDPRIAAVSAPNARARSASRGAIAYRPAYGSGSAGGGGGSNGGGGSWQPSRGLATLDEKKAATDREDERHPLLKQNLEAGSAGGGGAGVSVQDLENEAGARQKMNLADYLPDGRRYQGRALGGMYDDRKGIQPVAVDIWGQITRRMHSVCREGRLHDCQLPRLK